MEWLQTIGEGLRAGDPAIFPVLTFLIRFLLPALAVIIVLRCARSLLREDYEPEVWAHLSLPNGSRVALYHWENVIGRAKSCDVVLNYPVLSRSHCALIRDAAGRWKATDLRSKGGVTINGKHVSESAEVFEGDVLGMGGVEVTLLELKPEELKRQGKERTRPGRRIKPSGTLFFLTLFQALLCLQLMISAGDGLTADLPAAFLTLAGSMWIYFLVVRAMGRTGFEAEALAFFLSSIGFGVVAVSAPEDLTKQSVLLLVSLLGFAVCCCILRDLSWVKRLRWPVSALGILALLSSLVFGQSVYGATNWITIGGVSLQPSELVKVAFIFAGAATLDRLFARRNLILFIGYSGMCVGVLALMNDFGAAVIFFAVFLIIAFLRSGDLATVALSIAAAAFAGMLALTVKPHIASRFSTWGHAWEDPYGAGMQQVLTMSYAASGGLFGLGAGNGNLKNVVFANTDLVFGIICEELGLFVGLCAIGALVILGLFVIKSAASGRSTFYVIAAGAAVTFLFVQMLLNVLGSMDILPFTGVTFPFVSKGGSSLLACWCLLAFVKAADTRQSASIAIRLPWRFRQAGRDDYADPDEPDEDEGEEVSESWEEAVDAGDWDDGAPYGDMAGNEEYKAAPEDCRDDPEIDPRYFEDEWD